MANTYPFAQRLRVGFGARRSGVEPDAATYQPANGARPGSHELCPVMHSYVLRGTSQSRTLQHNPSNGKRVQIFSYCSVHGGLLVMKHAPKRQKLYLGAKP